MKSPSSQYISDIENIEYFKRYGLTWDTAVELEEQVYKLPGDDAFHYDGLELAVSVKAHRVIGPIGCDSETALRNSEQECVVVYKFTSVQSRRIDYVWQEDGVEEFISTSADSTPGARSAQVMVDQSCYERASIRPTATKPNQLVADLDGQIEFELEWNGRIGNEVNTNLPPIRKSVADLETGMNEISLHGYLDTRAGRHDESTNRASSDEPTGFLNSLKRHFAQGTRSTQNTLYFREEMLKEFQRFLDANKLDDVVLVLEVSSD